MATASSPSSPSRSRGRLALTLSPPARASLDVLFAPRALHVAEPAPAASRGRRSSITAAALDHASHRRHNSVQGLAGAIATQRLSGQPLLAAPTRRGASASPAVPRVSKPTNRFHLYNHTVDAVIATHGFLIDTDVSALADATGMSRRSLSELFLLFKALCMLSKRVEGVDNEAFHRFVPTLATEDATFVQRVFEVSDASGCNAVSWHDFVGALAALDGTPTQRAEFLFRCYDRHGHGYLDVNDLAAMYGAAFGVTSEALEHAAAQEQANNNNVVGTGGHVGFVHITMRQQLTLPTLVRQFAKSVVQQIVSSEGGANGSGSRNNTPSGGGSVGGNGTEATSGGVGRRAAKVVTISDVMRLMREEGTANALTALTKSRMTDVTVSMPSLSEIMGTAPPPADVAVRVFGRELLKPKEADICAIVAAKDMATRDARIAEAVAGVRKRRAAFEAIFAPK